MRVSYQSDSMEANLNFSHRGERQKNNIWQNTAYSPSLRNCDLYSAQLVYNIQM